jgi:uncharacterized protein
VNAIAATSESQRIDSLDVIRGFAVLGILLMNIVAMGLPIGAYSDPTVLGGATGWNLRVWFVNELLFEGTMRGLFSMLFGAGVILFTARHEARGAGLELADCWYRRMIWLFIFGLVHAYILLWPWDVLYSYGLLGMFLFPLRNVSPLRLTLLGTGLILAGTAVEYRGFSETVSRRAEARQVEALMDRGETPTDEQKKALQAWVDEVEEWNSDSPEEMEGELAAMRGGYVSAFPVRAGETWYAESMWHYGSNYFDMLPMMLAGMAMFRWGIFQAERPFAFYAIMTLAGYGIGLPVNFWENSILVSSNFAIVESGKVGLSHELGRVATTVGHVGLIVLFCKSGALPFLQRALAAVGRMALTNYILHTVISTTIFVVIGQFGLWERHQLYYLVGAIWAVQLVFSPVWLRYFHFGPLEWLWRGLTYGKRPTLFKETRSAPVS